jgi:hypothetical protein
MQSSDAIPMVSGVDSESESRKRREASRASGFCRAAWETVLLLLRNGKEAEKLVDGDLAGEESETCYERMYLHAQEAYSIAIGR